MATALLVLGAPAAIAADATYAPGDLSPRRHELWVNWIAVGADLHSDIPNVQTGGGLELAPYLSPVVPWLRPTLYGAVLAGTWGDRRHGPTTIEAGSKLRLDLPTGELGTVYVVQKATFLHALEGRRSAVALGAGAGLRLMRAVSGEVAFDLVRALSSADRFEGTTGERPAVGRVTATLGVDLCGALSFGACRHDAPRPRVADVTCSTYARARGLGDFVLADPPRRESLCRAVDAALDAAQNPPGPGETGTDALLRHLGAQAISSEVDQAVAELARNHSCQSRRRDASTGDARRAALRGRSVSVRLAYAPHPAYLRRALGCSPEAPTDAMAVDRCTEVAEEARACAAPGP